MKNARLLTVAGLAVFAMLAGSISPVYAQESQSLTDDHITRIKTNCQSAIATLDQIHANDAPVYINRNQAYFSISDKLIARLNSRLALNRFDTSTLVSIASDYNTELTHFRAAYKKYDTAMAELVKRNCSRQPVAFYDAVADVRKLREEVHSSISRLHGYIDQYRSAVNTFETQHDSQLRANANDR